MDHIKYPELRSSEQIQQSKEHCKPLKELSEETKECAYIVKRKTEQTRIELAGIENWRATRNKDAYTIQENAEISGT